MELVIELCLKRKLETCLLLMLQQRQVVVMDNAIFHKGGRIQQLIQDAGGQLLYLPPYSPDINKIEKCWLWLKSRIGHQLTHFDCLPEAIENVLRLVSGAAGRGCYKFCRCWVSKLSGAIANLQLRDWCGFGVCLWCCICGS